MIRIGDFDVEVTFDGGEMFLAFVDGIEDFSVDVEVQIEHREMLR